MKNNELGMTFRLLHLPVYVKKITLITFGFCFVSLQLGSVLCSLLLVAEDRHQCFQRSVISLLPISQGCKKKKKKVCLELWQPSLQLVYYSDRLLVRMRCVRKWKLKKLSLYEM